MVTGVEARQGFGGGVMFSNRDRTHDDVVHAESSLLFPVGHLRGVSHHRAMSSTSDYTLRLGREIIALSLDEFIVWSHAHGTAPDVHETAWTRGTVAEVASDVGLTEPADQVIDRLAGYGALAQVKPYSDDEVAFAKKHRVFPLMLGLGNTANTPWMYRIGLPHAVVSTVLADVYELWDGIHLGENLWSACQALASGSHSSEHVGTKDLELDELGPTDLLHQFLGELHGLLSANCIYVDIAIAGGQAQNV